MFKKNLKNIRYSQGLAAPLGPSNKNSGINFALFSEHAKNVKLALFKEKSPTHEIIIPLDPKLHKTGHIWHILLDNPPKTFEYAFLIDDNWALDPYAKSLNTSTTWGDPKNWENAHGAISKEKSFDWGKLPRPKIPWENLIIYEMHIRGFTKDKSSKSKHPGTFNGVIEKIPHLKKLGINAVELMPIFEFNESSSNYWGYSPINFFSPMPRYGTKDPIFEFKTMVKELHKAGIEVLLDVVFNHTGEQDGSMSFRSIDHPTYFLSDDDGNDLNFTGCGNTLNCNHPIMIQFILKTLRYWTAEMHVDGFRFDLASIFTRGENGHPLDNPPLIQAINDDPILSHVKLIAEPWDCGGLYQVGSFPSQGNWAEWNGKYRDNVRKFIKGTDGQVGAFATALAGSEDLFGYRNMAPYHSINFITAHDGFTLHDLVTYQEKHNEANNEDNQDGNNCNESWNCGLEGPTIDPHITAFREKQMRNFLMALFLSIGTPMLLMGDEYGHTRQGNNNPYCQDNNLNHFLWDQLKNNKPLFQLVQKLIAFRKSRPELNRKNFLTASDITWHGHHLEQPDWSETSRFIAYSFQNEFYIAFNAHHEPAQIELPPHKKWNLLIDSSLTLNGPLESSCQMAPYSSLLLT